MYCEKFSFSETRETHSEARETRVPKNASRLDSRARHFRHPKMTRILARRECQKMPRVSISYSSFSTPKTPRILARRECRKMPRVSISYSSFFRNSILALPYMGSRNQKMLKIGFRPFFEVMNCAAARCSRFRAGAAMRRHASPHGDKK